MPAALLEFRPKPVLINAGQRPSKAVRCRSSWYDSPIENKVYPACFQ